MLDKNMLIFIHAYYRPIMYKNFAEFNNIKKFLAEKLTNDIKLQSTDVKKIADLEYNYFMFCKNNKIEDLLYISMANMHSNGLYKVESSLVHNKENLEVIQNLFEQLTADNNYTIIFRDPYTRNRFFDYITIDQEQYNIIDLFDINSSNDVEVCAYIEAMYNYFVSYEAASQYETFKWQTEKPIEEFLTLVSDYTNKSLIDMCEFYSNKILKKEKILTNEST